MDELYLMVDDTPLNISSLDLEIGDGKLVDLSLNTNVLDPHKLIMFTFSIQKAVIKEQNQIQIIILLCS